MRVVALWVQGGGSRNIMGVPRPSLCVEEESKLLGFHERGAVREERRDVERPAVYGRRGSEPKGTAPVLHT